MIKAKTGKLLFVDLTKAAFEERVVPDEWYERFIGGAGIGIRVLHDEIPAGTDALGPANVLGFMSGLLTGTGSVVTGRWTALAKSPLTGGIGDSNCGGDLSIAIKQCGYDGIFFRGASAAPVTFVLDSKGPRLEDASALWGIDAIETEERLKAAWKAAKRPAVAAIGPAAEKMSLISGISNDGGRYAGRSGLGAVMGSKRLKALVLSGLRQVPVADVEKVKSLSKAYSAKVKKQSLPPFLLGRFLPALGHLLGGKTVVPMDGMLSAGIYRKWGTNANSMIGAVNGDAPVRNWDGSPRDFPRRKYIGLNPDKIRAREIRKYHCYSCAIGCGSICDISDLVPGRTHSHKPEYETATAFGGLALSGDLDAVFRCNDICNRGGLDTISAGAVVAFAIECFEKGALTKEDTGGLELSWGDSAAMEKLLVLMTNREGIGAVLADGVRKAAERIGKGSEAWAVHAGGQEPGMHDPRMDPQLGVAYSADPTPGRHTIAAASFYNLCQIWEFVPWAPAMTKPYPKSEEYLASEVEGRKSAVSVCLKQVLDASGGCLFAVYTGLRHWRLFDWLNAATGWERSPEDYIEAGRRIQTLRQLFNLRQGLDPRDSVMKGRLRGDPPLTSGPLQGIVLDIEGQVAEHWAALGWDRETGRPTAETLRALGIEEFGPPRPGSALDSPIGIAKGPNPAVSIK